MIKALQFNLMYPTQSGFLDRYLRIFSLDRLVKEKKYARTVRDATKYLLRFMIRDSSFLKFRASQMAAVSLLVAMNAQSALFRHQARQKKEKKKFSRTQLVVTESDLQDQNPEEPSESKDETN